MEDLNPIPSLEEWYRRTSEDDFLGALSKLASYGSTDLAEIGWSILSPFGGDRLSDREAALQGVMFYLTGKLVRLRYQLSHGIDASDTLHDITVYSMMARSILERGRWG